MNRFPRKRLSTVGRKHGMALQELFVMQVPTDTGTQKGAYFLSLPNVELPSTR